MLRIRLRRVGSKRQPSYRIIVADSRSPRDGRFVEKIGFYNPRTEPVITEVDEARALYWLGQGARPSDAVQRILTWVGTTDRYSRLKAGEDVSALVAEATAAQESRAQVGDRRTRRDDLTQQRVSKKSQAKAAAAEAVAAKPAPVEPVAEAVVEMEPAVEAETAEDSEEAESS
jgi:small subunit ribosomal protein S16